MKPFLKWAGGKSKLLPQLVELRPQTYNTYFEPFLGSGALFFRLKPTIAVLSDVNSELINLYLVVKENVSGLIAELGSYKNSEEIYYLVRHKDRDPDYSSWTSIQKAARFLYLNKTCWNGLYRVNSEGYFNVPYGNRKNVNIIDKKTLLACSALLQTVNILNNDFEYVLSIAKKDDFLFIDPPYIPITDTSFTSYTVNGFSIDDHIRLRNMCDVLHDRGVKFMISNSNAGKVLELYKNYNISTIYAPRFINSKGDSRGQIKEVVITNYEIKKAQYDWWDL